MHEKALHDVVLDRWGEEIATGTRPVGSRISTEAAAEEFGASRSVIREVARVLESYGMVELRQRVGITVRPASAWAPFEGRILKWRLAGPERLEMLRSLSEMRAAVEPVAARLAAERATPEQCGALAAAYIGMSSTARAANAEEYLRHDSELHRVLLDASGNDMIASLGGVVVAVLEGRTRHELMPPVADADALRLHGDLVAAVQGGDGALAEAAARQIVEEARAAMLQE